jgi:hypothetical protein
MKYIIAFIFVALLLPMMAIAPYTWGSHVLGLSNRIADSISYRKARVNHE